MIAAQAGTHEPAVTSDATAVRTNTPTAASSPPLNATG
jgi:hypothetical protein